MQSVIDIIKWFGVTSYLAFGLIWFEFFGSSVLFLMFAIYVLASLLDVALGYYIAWKHKIVTSKSFSDWLVSKVIKWIVVAGITALFSHISYISSSEILDAILAFIAYWITGLFLYWELISIVENNILISDGKNKVVLQFLAKILGVWYEFVQKKLEKKLEEVTNVH